MSTFTITEWENHEGHTYGYDDAGNCLVTINPLDDRTRTREWFVTDEANNDVAAGEANDLRAAKKDAKAALARAINS